MSNLPDLIRRRLPRIVATGYEVAELVHDAWLLTVPKKVRRAFESAK